MSILLNRGWNVDGFRVEEEVESSGIMGARLNCLSVACINKPWCKHRSTVLMNVMDAPLMKNYGGHRWLNLEVQPSIGFYVPVKLVRISDVTSGKMDHSFHAFAYAPPKGGVKAIPVHNIGEFFASDGRIGIRDTFVDWLRQQMGSGLECGSTAHQVLKNRKPTTEWEAWQILSLGGCLQCSQYHDTSSDVPF